MSSKGSKKMSNGGGDNSDGSQGNDNEDSNRDHCHICNIGGNLWMCDFCPLVYHEKCLKTIKVAPPDEESETWKCPECSKPHRHFSLEIGANVESLSDRELYKLLGLFESTTAPKRNSKRTQTYEDIYDDDSKYDGRSRPTLGAIILYLEWHITVRQAEIIAGAMAEYFGTTLRSTSKQHRGSLQQQTGTRTPFNTKMCKSLNFYRMLKIVQETVGSNLYTAAMNEIMQGGASFAHGLSPSFTNMTKHCNCGAVRFFHLFCFHCGTLFDVKKEVVGTMGDRLPKATNAKGMPLSIDEVESRRADYKLKTLGTGSRAADVLFDITREEKGFKIHGGYFCLLTRALALVSDQSLQSKYRQEYISITQRFMKAHTQIDTTQEDFVQTMTNLVSGLHNIANLCDGNSCLVKALTRVPNDDPPVPPPAPSKTLQKLKQMLIPIDLEILVPDADDIKSSPMFRSSWMKRSRIARDPNEVNPYLKPVERRSLQSVNSDSVGETGVKRPFSLMDHIPQKGRSIWDVPTAKRMNMGDDDDTTPSSLDAGSKVRAAKRQLDEVHDFLAEVNQYHEIVQNEIMVPILQREMTQYGTEDYWSDFHPDSGMLPLTKLYCGSCHADLKKGASRCEFCNFKGTSTKTIDYPSCYDGLCLPFIYRYTHEQLKHRPKSGSKDFLKSLVKLFPIVRSYVNGSDTMGLQMFKFQCYFATHVIYAFSDYGQYALNRQLFSEEFEFFVRNMEYCMTFRDPSQSGAGDCEIVCEFVHCLKVLGYTPKNDPELEPLINNVYDYIMKREVDLKGNWHHKKSTYDRYHGSYVAAICLADYGFLDGTTSDKIRLPSILKFL